MPCEFCGHSVPLEWDHCPHCARPSLFPNVRMAELPEERAAVERRYRKAVRVAEAEGCKVVFGRLEQLTAVSKAVIARKVTDVEQLAREDSVYPTYYLKLDSGVQLPSNDKWDELRGMADEKLFRHGKKHVRFAALSLDGCGLWNYGECSLVLREDMIGHRASVFEGNSALFLKKTHYSLKPGFRASWRERQKLCVAKLASSLTPEMTDSDLAGSILHEGPSSEEDRFVEVHIWGSMSARTLERVILRREAKPRTLTEEIRLRDKLVVLDIPLEVVTR